MPIRALIVDDETHARSRLRQMLKPESDVETIGECANGGQALDSIKSLNPDLVFLDVQMPKLSGIEVCEKLATSHAPMPLVIFVTAYDEFAVRAFEVHAVDYLLKPFDRERLQKSLQHVRTQLDRSKSQPVINAHLAALLEEFRPGVRKFDRLVFKQDGRVVFLRIENLDWVEADGNYVRLHAGTDSHYVRETLAGIEAQLPADKFLRISRSVLVNLDRIKEMQPLFYGDYVVLLQNGSRLNLTRHFRARLEAILSRRV
jgi:two-component system, LytTR family, response regulator